MGIQDKCNKSINGGLDRCSRRAVVDINGSHYCKQHALKVLPIIRILPRVGHKEGLKQNLVDRIFLDEHPW